MLCYVPAHVAPTAEIYVQWVRLSALGWNLSPALALHFFVLLTRPPVLAGSRFVLSAIYAPVVPFLYRSMNGDLLLHAVERAR